MIEPMGHLYLSESALVSWEGAEVSPDESPHQQLE